LRCIRRYGAVEWGGTAADVAARGTGAGYLHGTGLVRPSQGKRDPGCRTTLRLPRVPWAERSGWQVTGQAQPFPPWTL